MLRSLLLVALSVLLFAAVTSAESSHPRPLNVPLNLPLNYPLNVAPIVSTPLHQQPILQQPVVWQQQPVLRQPIVQQPILQQPIVWQQPQQLQPRVQLPIQLPVQQPILQRPIVQQQPRILPQQTTIVAQQPRVQPIVPQKRAQPIAQQQPIKFQQPAEELQPQMPVAKEQPIVQKEEEQQQPITNVEQQQPIVEQKPQELAAPNAPAAKEVSVCPPIQFQHKLHCGSDSCAVSFVNQQLNFKMQLTGGKQGDVGMTHEPMAISTAALSSEQLGFAQSMLKETGGSQVFSFAMPLKLKGGDTLGVSFTYCAEGNIDCDTETFNYRLAEKEQSVSVPALPSQPIKPAKSHAEMLAKQQVKFAQPSEQIEQTEQQQPLEQEQEFAQPIVQPLTAAPTQQHILRQPIVKPLSVAQRPQQWQPQQPIAIPHVRQHTLAIPQAERRQQPQQLAEQADSNIENEQQQQEQEQAQEQLQQSEQQEQSPSHFSPDEFEAPLESVRQRPIALKYSDDQIRQRQQQQQQLRQQMPQQRLSLAQPNRWAQPQQPMQWQVDANQQWM